ncbi:MAG: histidine phosphatase family protein [Saccharospirillaceae bacterium]|nr:histidine phosphatase family protein [Colwellia sp.]NRB77290.1 histidine phosphatase family protein [Saccharospirillaceae bacterium]
MAAIYLIRHGQASFGKADYDQLSDKGIAQSELLGKYWQSQSTPEKIYAGDLLRHGQTLEHFLLGYQSKEPSVTLHSGFNEFNHVDLLACYDARWNNFARMAVTVGKQPGANKIFQKEFAQALERWTCGKNDSDYKESWPQFQTRCITSLKDVINQELSVKNKQKNKRTKDICIFTSGGVIAVIIQHILGLSNEKALVVNQQLRNTSVTKLLCSGDSLNIDYLNNYGHLTLEGADWVTFR